MAREGGGVRGCGVGSASGGVGVCEAGCAGGSEGGCENGCAGSGEDRVCCCDGGVKCDVRR